MTYDDGAGGTRNSSSLIPTGSSPHLGEVDTHLISEGRHERLWEVLGARLHSYTTPDGEVHGVSSSWRPMPTASACNRRLLDNWSGRMFPMRSLGSGTGVWEIFIHGMVCTLAAR